MPARILFLLAVSLFVAFGQTVCQPTPVYTPCEISFELTPEEAKGNPYQTVELEAEFRSPRFRTSRVAAFWDGGQRMVLRFTPVETGTWLFRVTSNVKRFDSQQGEFPATDASARGFLQPANVHHWAIVDENVRIPHLWMGDTVLTFPWIDIDAFHKIVDTRAGQKFNHIRGVLFAPPGSARNAFASPGQPEVSFFRDLDERVRYMNSKGIIADLVLAWAPDQIVQLLPSWQDRERFLRYVVARYAAYHVTWQLANEFENSDGSRALLKELGLALKKFDVYHHPRTTGALMTSSPLLGDDWMNSVAYGSADDQLGSIEHQIYGVPFVNLRIASEDSGGGRSTADDGDADAFRHRLWNAAMDGEYPTFSNTGVSGMGKLAVDPKFADSPAAKQMSVWFDFFAATRHWELEPYFEVEGGRAVALERTFGEETEGIEYIVYVEKPGPVEITLQKHGYDVSWFNPITGESIKLKGFKADRFSGEPPDKTHDWVLHISREGRKESLRSYKFESRPIIMQEIEQAPQKAPFEISEPAGDVSVSKPPKFAVKLTRETRATRSMMYLWTGEVASDQQGFRVIGTGAQGTFAVPSNLTSTYPANLAVRLYGLNAHGKVYSLIRIYQLTK